MLCDHCTNYNQILERHRYLDGRSLHKPQNSTVLLPSSVRVSFRGAAYRTRQESYELVALSLLLWAFARKKPVGKFNSGRDTIQHYLRLYQHNRIRDFSDYNDVRQIIQATLTSTISP